MKQTITIDHIGIASTSLDEGSQFWRLIGLTAKGEDDHVEDQGVVTRFFPLGQVDHSETNIEILEPTGPDTPIGKFLGKRGPGIQQLCLAVDDLEQ